MPKEVIHLVLDDARKKILRDKLRRGGIPVPGLHVKFAESRHASTKLGNAQTSFPVFEKRVVEDLYLRIYQHRQRDFPARSVALDHCQRQGFMNLRSSKTNAVVFVHC